MTRSVIRVSAELISHARALLLDCLSQNDERDPGELLSPHASTFSTSLLRRAPPAHFLCFCSFICLVRRHGHRAGAQLVRQGADQRHQLRCQQQRDSSSAVLTGRDSCSAEADRVLLASASASASGVPPAESGLPAGGSRSLQPRGRGVHEASRSQGKAAQLRLGLKPQEEACALALNIRFVHHCVHCIASHLNSSLIVMPFKPFVARVHCQSNGVADWRGKTCVAKWGEATGARHARSALPAHGERCMAMAIAWSRWRCS